jgi:hypothetical protein
LAIRDIPSDFKLNDKQEIQLQCEKTNKPHINQQAIQEFFKTLEYPLYFLDFETYQTAIPLYDGLKPYQQIPFQFSVHKIDNNAKHEIHVKVLDDGKAFSSEVVDKNLFVALDSTLKKVLAEVTSHNRR